MEQSPLPFDFNTVGKKTPYLTPEGYFERSEAALKAQERLLNNRSRTTLRRWIYGTAASVVLLLSAIAIKNITNLKPQEATPAVYCQNANATEDWHDFAEADIFLENMDW